MSPPSYGSRDTAHAQPQNWRDPLAYSQNDVHDIARISKTTKPIKMKIHNNIGTIKMYSLRQYYNVTTNLRWRTAVILKIVKTPYLRKKLSDFDEIWHTLADYE